MAKDNFSFLLIDSSIRGLIKLEKTIFNILVVMKS